MMPQTWTFIAKLNSTCVPLRFLSIWKWAKGNNKTINDKEGNENEKVKSVELSRQIQMMWAMQPTKLTHGTSPLSHVAVCINTTEWISLYFILHFKCVDTLRFLWIQDMKAEIKLLFISLLFQTFCLPARLKSFFYCVYTKHMLKCIFFFFFFTYSTQFSPWAEHWLPTPISWILFTSICRSHTFFFQTFLTPITSPFSWSPP